MAALPETSPLWTRAAALRQRACALLDDIDARFHDFSDLDSRFHRLINAAAPNRFIDDFYDIITLIFHYHYQWNKRDERQRNEIAIREHLTTSRGLFSRNTANIELACRMHLASARDTLIRSTSGHAVSARMPRLRTHNQKMTVAAMQIALMKVWAQRSYRVAMRRQSLSLPNMRSIRLRCL